MGAPAEKHRIDPFSIIQVEQDAIDPLGKLFYFQGELYRGVYPNYVTHVRRLFDVGLIHQLISKGLFPDSRITNLISEDFPLIIWHQKISYPTYPHEWSFEMLRAAALTTLSVRQTACSFGFDLKDAHPDNILFQHTKAIFVDLGSFIEKTSLTSWIASERFIQSFLYPLKIWATGNEFFARRVFIGFEYLPHINYYLYASPLLRRVPQPLLASFLNLIYKYKKISSLTQEQLESSSIYKKFPPPLRKMLLFLFVKKMLPFQRFNVKAYKKKIEHLGRPSPLSRWAKYHSDLNQEIPLEDYARFKTITEEILKLNCQTVTEIGANQGSFSRLLYKSQAFKQAACLDIDEGAVDIGYSEDTKNHIPITRAVLDIIHPITTTPKLPPAKRFVSEVVIALALTHHLILAQNIPLHKLITILSEYTTRYIAIEFMPHGFDLTYQKKGVPEWYTEKWFSRELSKHYRILTRIDLEPNRILFIGEKVKNLGSDSPHAA